MKIKPASKEAYQLFHEGTLALSQVEANGFRIDLQQLQKTIKETDKEIKTLERELQEDEIFRLWRRRYSNARLGSHNQLGVIFFGEKNFKGLGFQRKSGKNDESSFEKIKHPFKDKWFRWQKKLKLRNTYLRGIETEVEGEYIHAFENLHLASTYRSSMDSPNLQNQPVRNEEIARAVRSNFIARENHLIVENDFAGIEVRGATCYNLDPVMIQYIKNNYDYHREYAAKCFKIKPDDVSKKARYCGKNQFVFPEFYGSYWFDCARNLWESCERMGLDVNGIPMREHLKSVGIKSLGKQNKENNNPTPGTFEHHIAKVEKKLWETLHVYAQWKKDWYQKYLKLGYVELLTGFICSGVMDRKMVINYPIQGTAFHFLLWVLTQLQKWLNKYKMKSKIVLQIHDSLIGDVHVSELDDYLHYVKYLVEIALPRHFPWIVVPMEIETEICPEGKSWYEKRVVSI